MYGIVPTMPLKYSYQDNDEDFSSEKLNVETLTFTTYRATHIKIVNGLA